MKTHWLIIPCVALLTASCATSIPPDTLYQLGAPIKYPGDLDSIPAIPKCAAIRRPDSGYLTALRDMGFPDLTSYLASHDLLLYTESIAVRSLNLSPKGDAIWVQVEDALPDGGFADPPKKESFLHLILLKKTKLPIMNVKMERIAE